MLSDLVWEIFAGNTAHSVRIGDTCTNIIDMSVGSACVNFRGGSGAHVQLFSGSDSCSSGAIAFVGDDTTCADLNFSGNTTHSVRLDGTCTNIVDTSVGNACVAFGGGQ